MTAGSRPQLKSSDVAEPERLRAVLNDIFLDFAKRLEALEATKGLVEIEFTLETGAVIAPDVRPFGINVAGTRTSCPFTPTGLTLLRVDRTMPAGQPVSTQAHEVKWHFAAGPNAAEGTLHIDFVTGLEINSRYAIRVGVTRA